ncbi:MAG: PhoH family protein, partial [Planctomycetota bacterium]
KMLLTRLGVGSKMVISGDTTQVDLPSNRDSGLVDAMQRLQDVPGCTCVRLSGSDIVRHPLVQRIVQAYDGDGHPEERPRRR